MLTVLFILLEFAAAFILPWICCFISIVLIGQFKYGDAMALLDGTAATAKKEEGGDE